MTALGDELLAVLPELREMAESMMFDTLSITRPGEPVTDENGDVTTDGPEVYSGKAKIQSREAQEADPEVAGASLTINRYEVHVPVAKTVEDYKPAVGDVVTVAAAVNDPHLTGQVLRVVALLHKTNATAYRLGVTVDETREAS